MSERGSIVVPLLGLFAAMAVATVIVARDGLHRRQEAKRIHLRAVARNLAEAGIVAGRMGRNVPAGLFGPALEGIQSSVRLTRGALPGGRQRLVSTAAIRTSSGGAGESGSIRYVIEVTLARGADGRQQVVSWQERQRHSAKP